MRLHCKRDSSESRRRLLQGYGLPVFEPTARSGKEQTQRIWSSIFVEIPILNEQITKGCQPLPIAGAVRRAIKKTSTFIKRLNGAAFRADKCVPGHSMGEHSIEANERPFWIVSSQCIQDVSHAI